MVVDEDIDVMALAMADLQHHRGASTEGPGERVASGAFVNLVDRADSHGE